MRPCPPIRGRLLLYFLKNSGFEPEPHTPSFVVSDDGERWSKEADLDPAGWLFWRPKTRDGATWYVIAYWHEHGKSIILKSGDTVRHTRYLRPAAVKDTAGPVIE